MHEPRTFERPEDARGRRLVRRSDLRMGERTLAGLINFDLDLIDLQLRPWERLEKTWCSYLWVDRRHEQLTGCSDRHIRLTRLRDSLWDLDRRPRRHSWLNEVGVDNFWCRRWWVHIWLRLVIRIGLLDRRRDNKRWRFDLRERSRR